MIKIPVRPLALALLMGAAACNQRQPAMQIVTGTMANAAGSQIVLAALPAGSATRIAVDSATLLDDVGEFRLQTAAGPEGVYQIFVTNGPGFLLINDVPIIAVKADAAAPEKYSVEGSPASAAIIQLYRGFAPLQRAAASAELAATAAEGNPAMGDSLMLSILEKSTNARLQLQQWLLDWINQQTNPTAIYIGLALARPFVAPADWYAAWQAASTKWPNHTGIAVWKPKTEKPKADSTLKP